MVTGRKQCYYTYFLNYGVDMFILSKTLRNLGLANLKYEWWSVVPSSLPRAFAKIKRFIF